MNKRLAGMTAVAALLGGYVAVEGLGLFQSPDSVNAPAAESAAARSEALKLNPLDGLDPESFTAIVDKPLFNPSRQARPAEPVAPPPVEQPVVEQPPPPPPPPREAQRPPHQRWSPPGGQPPPSRAPSPPSSTEW